MQSCNHRTLQSVQFVTVSLESLKEAVGEFCSRDKLRYKNHSLAFWNRSLQVYTMQIHGRN